jgi:hypothetical protein
MASIPGSLKSMTCGQYAIFDSFDDQSLYMIGCEMIQSQVSRSTAEISQPLSSGTTIQQFFIRSA